MKARPLLYDRVAEETASVVIRRYSTSFGLASRLLDLSVRQHVENIYALVRVADEIVDGGVPDPVVAARALNDLEAETETAMQSGHSANLVVHAFALTARETGFGSELTKPFFDSMRTDLTVVEHDQASFDRYVYGSAEVVGLMCLRVFTCGQPIAPEQVAELDVGASRLGAAFQKVNFLRDLGDDDRRLGRVYLPGAAPGSISETEKAAAVAEIRADLAAAQVATAGLPRDCRRAVRVASAIFGELLRRIDRTPAARLADERISVPAMTKLWLVLRWSLAPGGPKR